MASEEDADIDKIDEELARVEEQIEQLDGDEDEPPEPEAPDPEPDDVEAPNPEEAFEGEPDVDEDPGLLGGVMARLREAREPAEDEPDDDQDEASAPEDEQASTEPAEDEQASTETPEEPEADRSQQPEEPDEGSSMAFWRSKDEEPVDDEASIATEDDEAHGDEAGPEAASDEELEAEPEPADEPAADDDPEEGEPGMLGGVMSRFGSDEEATATGEAATPAAAAHGEVRQAPPPTGPTSVAGRAHPAPAEAAREDEGESGARASALLARFQGGGSDDPDPDEGVGDDDDEDRGLLVPALVAVLLLAGIAAAAYVLIPGGGDDELDANLVADAFTDDEGRYVATTGQAITLDASASAGDVEEYVWNFDDGSQQTTSEPTVEHTYQQRGSYDVEVTIRSSGGEDTATIGVQIIDAPTADARILLEGEPVAQPRTIGNNVFVGDQVSLDGAASTADAEHTLTSYSWDVDGDGEPEATGREAQLGFEGVGAWAVNLTVRDDLGNTDTTTRLVHVSDRLVAEGTLGPSTTEADSDNHTVAVDEARLGARPIQLDVQLTYNASGDGGDLPVQPEVDADLDLNVTDPEGNLYEVEDDDGQGEETLTLPAEELTNLGDWTVTVQQDTQNAGTASEAEYELVVDIVY